jgi:hypothetical protein
MPSKSAFTKTAQFDAMRLNLPYAAYKAYIEHAGNAQQRKILFLFTMPQWWDFWQVENRWSLGGMGGQKLVMARFGDKGPYSPDNVYYCTHVQNVRDIDTRSGAEKRRARWAAKTPEQLVAQIGGTLADENTLPGLRVALTVPIRTVTSVM